MNIVGKHVVLRAPEMRDVELLHKWANDPALWKLLVGWHFPYSSLSTEKWVSATNNNNLSGHVFAVEVEGVGLIGTANLVNIDWKNRNAYHGMMLGDTNARGKGLGLDTVMAIMRYAFDELGMARLDTDMIETNTRSIDFYTNSCGWEIEGRRKNSFYREGKYFDKIVAGVTRDSYYNLVEKTGYWNS
jgi:RimJ/RimL family protein N-acetyltransferase